MGEKLVFVNWFHKWNIINKMRISKQFLPDLRYLSTSPVHRRPQHHSDLQQNHSQTNLVKDLVRKDNLRLPSSEIGSSSERARKRFGTNITTQPLKQRHKQIKEHFRMIKVMIESPELEGLNITTKSKDINSIKKTEISSNNVFTEKELNRLTQNHRPDRGLRSPKKHDRSNFIVFNSHPSAVRKEIEGYLEWGSVTQDKVHDRDELNHKRFVQRDYGQASKIQVFVGYPKPATENSSRLRQEVKKIQQKTLFFKRAKEKIEEETQQVSRKILADSKKYFGTKNSPSQTIRMQGLYEARMIKFSQKLLGRKGYPYILHFDKENEGTEEEDFNRSVKHQISNTNKNSPEAYHQWLKQEKKRFNEKLHV